MTWHGLMPYGIKNRQLMLSRNRVRLHKGWWKIAIAGIVADWNQKNRPQGPILNMFPSLKVSDNIDGPWLKMAFSWHLSSWPFISFRHNGHNKLRCNDLTHTRHNILLRTTCGGKLLRYHIIDLPGVLGNNVLGVYKCSYDLSKHTEQ